MTAAAAPARAVLGPTVAGAGVALLVRGRGFNDEIDADPAVYLTVGSNVLHGWLPYRDIFDHKGPLTYWLFAGLDLVLPASPVAIRLVLFAAFVASLALLVSLVARAGGVLAAWTAALTYAIAGSSLAFAGSSPNLEQLLAPALVGAVWAAERFERRRGLGWALLAGASIGAVAACKPPLGVLLGVLCLGLVTWRARGRWVGAAALVAGAVAVVA